MRQIELKSFGVQGLCLFLAGVLLLAPGCRDNPQDQAAKQVHQQIEAALASDDLAAAQQTVQSAVSSYRPTGMAQDSALLVSGNLGFARGLSLTAELPLKTIPMRDAAAAIADRLLQAQRWMLEKNRVEKMLALQDAEMAELKTLISGTAEAPGLEAQLASAKTELAQLEQQKQETQKQKDAIQAVIDDYRARAEALLRQADLAAGDEKLRLKQEAYALQLERKDDYVKAQAAENKIDLLNDQIALAEARVQRLQKNLTETQASIEGIQTSDSRKMLRDQMAEIDRLLSQQQTNMYEQADAITAGMAAYRQAVDEACQALLGAAEQYERVRSGDAMLAATVRLADSYTYAALACAEQMRFARQFADRLEGTLSAADESLVRGLPERLPLDTEFDAEIFQKIMDLFDRADTAYDQAMGLASRVPGQSGETAVSVLNSHLLAIQMKMQLADDMAQYDLASQTQARLEELQKQGAEFGSLFTLSETARLLEQGLRYIPTLPVNVELYFEGIRQRLTDWKRLTTPEEQAAAVEKNLAEMEALIRTFGDEMAQLLEPLKQEMLEAKERGFKAPEPAPGTTSTPGEPNNVPTGMPMGMPMGF